MSLGGLGGLQRAVQQPGEAFDVASLDETVLAKPATSIPALVAHQVPGESLIVFDLPAAGNADTFKRGFV